MIFEDDARLANLGHWSDAAPGMPLIFTDIAGEDSELTWMPRQGVQGAVNDARVETTPADDGVETTDRRLRAGDTFAMVVNDADRVEVVATGDHPPIEYAALDAIDLIDVTLQARTVAKAALVSAVSPPQATQALDQAIAESDDRASHWEVEGLTEVVIDSTDEAQDQNPGDAQPTV